MSTQPLSQTAAAIKSEIHTFFTKLDVMDQLVEMNGMTINAPALGETIASIAADTVDSLDKKVTSASNAQVQWEQTPRDIRSEFLNLVADKLDEFKAEFGRLITYEGGKKPILADGEVARAIGIIRDYVSKSTLPILEMPTGETLYVEKVCKAIGTVGLITTYNFPIAVASWNFAPALLAGNSVVWKPSEKTPLTAVAFKGLFDLTVDDFNSKKGHQAISKDILQVVVGGREVGSALVEHEKIDTISATGSTAMGNAIRKTWAEKKAGRTEPILELGGNNAIVVSNQCDDSTLELAVNAIHNSLLTNGGQFCTCARRVIIHESVYVNVVDKVKHKFEASISAGVVSNPLLGNVEGDAQGFAPLIDKDAWEKVMRPTLEAAIAEGGKVHVGGPVLSHDHIDQVLMKSSSHPEGGYYAKPTLVEMPDTAISNKSSIIYKETFAPVLFITKYKGDFQNAIDAVNAPPNAGLVNGLYTQSKSEFHKFALKVESGDIVVNTKIGTPNPMRHGAGFGGYKPDSGQGVALETSADPLGEFGHREHRKRITRNTKIELDKD
jgi:aldehyde dehydrogenase (NAD+)